MNLHAITAVLCKFLQQFVHKITQLVLILLLHIVTHKQAGPGSQQFIFQFLNHSLKDIK